MNVRLLLGVLAAAMVLAPAAYWWYWYQRATSVAGAILENAESRAASGDWRGAAAGFYQYLQVRPEDTHASIRLAEVYGRLAREAGGYDTFTRAIDLHRKALARLSEDPREDGRFEGKQDALRFELASLQLELGQGATASGLRSGSQEHLLYLRGAEAAARDLAADDGDGWALLGLALYSQHAAKVRPERLGSLTDEEKGRYRLTPEKMREKEKEGALSIGQEYYSLHLTPVAALERAHERKPARPELALQVATTLAEIYHSDEQYRQLGPDAPRRTAEERAERARQVMDELVARSSQGDKARALLARWRYRRQYEEAPVRAQGDLDAALAGLDPNSDDWQLLLDAALSASLGAQTGPSGDAHRLRQIAKRYYQRVAEIRAQQRLSGVPAAYWGLAQQYYAEGNFAKAAEICREGLVRVGGSSVEGSTLLVQSLLALGNAEEARKAWELLRQTQARTGAETDRTQREMILVDADTRLLGAAILAQEGKQQDAIDLIAGTSSDEPATSEAEPGEARAIIPTLVSLRDESGEVRERLFRAWTQLAGLYGRLKQWEEAAGAYQQAAALARGAHLPSRVAAVLARIEAGKLDDAIAAEKSAEVWLLAASDLYQRQTGLEPGVRNWSTLGQALSNLKGLAGREALRDPWRVELLEAAYRYDSAVGAVNRAEAARRAAVVLGEAEKTHEALRSGDEAQADSWRRFLQTIIARYEQLGLAADADRALDRFAELEQADAAAVPLVRSSVLVSRRQYDEAREVLAAALSGLDEAHRARLQAALVRISLRAGELERAQRELEDLKLSAPGDRVDAGLVMDLFDVALVLQDLAVLQRCEAALQKLLEEGDRDLLYCQARRLLAEADAQHAKVVPAEVAEARAKIAAEWPNWAGLHILDGLIRERQGDLRGALEKYEQAIRQGAASLSLFERVVPLAAMFRGADEARRYLALVEGNLPTEAGRLAEGYSDRLVDLSRRATERNPDDLDAWIRLSSALVLLSEEPEEGHEARKRALELLEKTPELAPQDVPAYFGLVGLSVRAGQTDDAEAVVARIEKDSKLPPADKATLLARCYRLVKDDARAEAKFREAAQLAPQDPAAWERLGDHLVATNSSGAEEAYAQAMGLAPDSARLRLKLAQVLAAQSKWDEAERLFVGSAGGAAGQPDSKLDPRSRAVVLAVLGGRKNFEAAIRNLEQVVEEAEQFNPNDDRLLAQLYEVAGDADAAAERHLALAAREEAEPADIASYVLFLLRRNALEGDPAQLDEAETWVAKLDELGPGNLATAALRVRLYAAQGREAEIHQSLERLATSLLERAGEEDQAKAGVYLSIGNLCSAADRHGEAEAWFRRLDELVPEAYAPLAGSLARQGRMAEAIDLCLKAAESDPSPRPASTLAAVLLAGQPTAEDLRRSEPVFAKALENYPDDAGLLMNVANVRGILQKEDRLDEAVALLRRVVGAQPAHSAALNNLATYLGEQPGKEEEALEYVDRAIQLHGPSAGLLDTKAMIKFAQGELDEARQLLEKAVLRRDPSARPDPRYHFHLAAVHLALGDAASAAEALRRARAGGLAGEVLTEADRRLLAQLDEKLAN